MILRHVSSYVYFAEYGTTDKGVAARFAGPSTAVDLMSSVVAVCSLSVKIFGAAEMLRIRHTLPSVKSISKELNLMKAAAAFRR